MSYKKLALLLSYSLLFNACATAPKSTLMGALIGGAIGAGIGQSHSRNADGTAVGLLVGSGIGSLIGYQSYKDQQKKNVPNKAENPEEIIPFLTKPKIRSYIVPDTIEGNKFIKSHRVFILEDPGAWTR